MTTTAIPDEKFNLKLSTKGGNSIAMIGSTRSGKSTALAYVLDKYFKKHLAVLMTNSPQADIYKSMKHCIQSPQYIPKVLKDMYAINRDTNNHYNFLTILDDVVTGVKFDKEILKLLTIYRNSDMSAIITAQAVTLLNSAGRTNINFVLLFKLNSDEQIEKCVKFYLSSYFPKDMRMLDKIRYYRDATQDHHFFVVDTLNGGVYRTKIDL
jgi:thymidylate kinase